MSGDVWVTGGRGFIGRHLAAELARRGRTVYAIGHGAWDVKDRTACGVSGWLNSSVSAAAFDALAADSGLPRVVYHLAGGSSVGASLVAPREDFSRTVEATAELVEWVRTRSPVTRIVAVSSAAVYGDTWRLGIPLTAPLRPCSPYGAHKAAMEAVLAGHARSFGLRVAIVRLFSIYGPGLEKQLIWELCGHLARGTTELCLGGFGTERRDFLYIADAVAMLADAESLASTEPTFFHGGTGRSSTVRELVDLVVQLWPARVNIQFNGAVRAGDPSSLIADMSGSEAIVSRDGLSLEVGLRYTIDAARRRLGAT